METKSDKPKPELYQNLLVTDFFGMRMIIVYNWLIGVACLGSKTEDQSAQELAARYFLTQFWAEFTIEVLQDFQMDDVEYRRQRVTAIDEAEKRKRIAEFEN